MSQSLTLLLNIATPDADQADTLTRALLRELRDSDAVEQAAMQESVAPDGAKGAWGDWLKVTFTPQNLEKLFAFIRDRLPGAPVIEMELEAGGKKLKLKAGKPEDLLALMKQAQKFIQE